MTDRNYAQIAFDYCTDIVSGKIPSNRYVMLACKRHLSDLAKSTDPSYPYRFDESKANHRCLFSERMPHTKGKWRGDLLKLEPWQVFIEACIWGWVRKKDGLRRFREAFILVPRKNGKSICGASTGLYGLVADDEKGSEIYSGASTEKQALEVFRPAWQMVQMRQSAFEKRWGVSLSGTPRNPTSIYRMEDLSRFELVIGNPPDGSSPHYAIIDEYHEHKSSNQYDTMSTGMGAREQPLIYVITTAGIDISSPCHDLDLKAQKVLEGSLEDETLFCIMWGLDDGDDWKDFKFWKRANPNYGISIMEDYLERKWKEALNDPSKQNINKCKHLNVWANAGAAWMNMAKWSACGRPDVKLSQHVGKPCYAAIDLASKIDICSLCVLIEVGEKEVLRKVETDDQEEREEKKVVKELIAFSKHYLPEETAKAAGNEHFLKWAKEGWITLTPGSRTDYAYIEKDLAVLHKSNPIIELCFDPREATYIISNVQTWLGSHWVDNKEVSRCIDITQGPAQMSEPMKEVEAMVYEQSLWHVCDPVATWMMGNVVKKQGRTTGPVKYYYPTKEKNEYKIDWPVALIMAISRAMVPQQKESGMDQRAKLGREVIRTL